MGANSLLVSSQMEMVEEIPKIVPGQILEVADLLVAYLEQIGVESVMSGNLIE